VDSSPDGRTWTGTRYFNQTSPLTPALAFYGDKLYLAYITADAPSNTPSIPSNRIFVCTTSDGLCWTPTIFIDHHSKCGPALAVFGDSLYIAYISNDSTNTIRYSSFTAATGWVAAKDTGHFSGQSPALVEYGGNLHMVFITNDGKNAIRHCEMPPGGTWGGASDIGQSTRAPPAIAVFNNDLYVAFVANNAAETLLISSSRDWSTATDTRQAASSNPGLEVFNDGGDKLFVGFPGKSSAECLLTSSSNPSTASGWPSSATDIRQRSQMGSGMALAITPFASGPQPTLGLSCLLAGSDGPRVYYRAETTGFLGEVVVRNGNAQFTPAWAGSSQYPAACGGGISSLYISDVGSRVYYLDPNNNIVELTLNQDGGSKFTRCVETADPHSPLTCLLAGSSGTRVYYTATQNGDTQVYEVPFWSTAGIVPEGPSADPTSFSPNALGAPVTLVAAQPNSPLTCLYISDIGSRGYYKDPSNHIVELALNDTQHGLVASFTRTDVPAAAGGLTCLLAGSDGVRVYYLAESNGKTYVRELTIINGVFSVTAPASNPIAALPGSALTCLYIGGVGSRVYYISENSDVCEWALGGASNPFTSFTGSQAAGDSPLTCTYIGGSGSRVYYTKGDGKVYELPFDGSPVLTPGASFSM
jgi:hypothetical protein